MEETGKTLTLNGKEYPLDTLSENARAQLLNIRVTNQEIARLQQRIAIAQTAHAAYARALQAELDQQQASSH